MGVEVEGSEMTHISKRAKELRAKIDPGKAYPIADAIKLVKEGASAKFNESVDVANHLGIDAKKSDQTVRGFIVLPKGTGKDGTGRGVRAGRQRHRRPRMPEPTSCFEDLAAQVKEGKIDFAWRSPRHAMRVVGQLGQVLGRAGLMPNPKVGTVPRNVADAVKNAKGRPGPVPRRQGGTVQCTIGRASFTEEALRKTFWRDGRIEQIETLGD